MYQVYAQAAPLARRAGAHLCTKVVWKGSATWSTRLSMGPLPVAAYCAAKPRKAIMARRPLRICGRGEVGGGAGLQLYPERRRLGVSQAGA